MSEIDIPVVPGVGYQDFSLRLVKTDIHILPTIRCYLPSTAFVSNCRNWCKLCSLIIKCFVVNSLFCLHFHVFFCFGVKVPGKKVKRTFRVFVCIFNVLL